MPTNDTPSAAGATNVLLNQRALDSPYRREAIHIQGDENPGKALGFDANGVLGAIDVAGNTSTFGLVANDPGAAAVNKAAWRSMMAYAAGRTQTTFVIPDGDYYLDPTFTGGVINVPSGTTIRMGKHTRIIVSIPTPLPQPDENSHKWIVFRIIGGASDILIEGGEIVGDKTTDLTWLWGYAYGVNINDGSERVTIRNMVIRDCWSDCLMVSGGSDIRIENVECYGGQRHCGALTGGKRVAFVGCRFSDPDWYMSFDMEIESPEDAEDVTFDRCIFSNSGYTGLAVVSGSSGKKAVRTKVLNCDFFGHHPRSGPPTPPGAPAGSGLALNVAYCTDTTIANCTFHDNHAGSDNISFGQNTGGLISGCMIKGGQKGIYLINSQRIAILGNDIQDTADDAIPTIATLAAYPLANNKIGANAIRNAGGRGIDIRGCVSQVFNNRIDRTQTQGIIVTSAQNILLSGNKVSEAGMSATNIDAISVTGTGHLICGNDAKKCAVSQSATAQAGGASTITLSANASPSDGDYVGFKVTILSGTGSGQTGTITGYVGSTKVATISSPWATPPNNTSIYEIIPAGNCQRWGLVNISECSLVYGNDTTLGGATSGYQESGTGTIELSHIVKSPDGTRYRIQVANGGALSTTPA